MKRLIFSLSCFLIFSFALIQVADAQLINYERRNQLLKGIKPKVTDAKRAKDKDEEVELPMWMKKIPKVSSREERRYDVNKDGKLQTAEVKVYLRKIIDVVDSKGGVTIKSAILKEYDKNRDGVINRYEVRKIKEDVK